MKVRKGSFCICNYLNPPDELADKAIIEVRDNTSRSLFLKLELSKKDLTNAVTGKNVDCKFEISTKFVGKKRIIKRENIKVSDMDLTDEDKAKILAPYEKNGWKGYGDNLTNHHNSVFIDGKLFQRVTFIKYIDLKKKRRKK